MDGVIVVAVFLICLGIPFGLAGLWWWFTFWWIIGITLALTELIAKLTTGNTISKMFWNWKNNPKTPAWKKWLVLAGMVIFWGYLICHLFLQF